VVVRFLIDGGERRTHEILYGILDQNILGDLVLITRTRTVRSHGTLIHAAASRRSGLAEGAELNYRMTQDRLSSSPDDPAEILGLVVYDGSGGRQLE
jgi:hypothetical protein